MEWSLLFVLNSILLGVGLTMDAFSVSLDFYRTGNLFERSFLNFNRKIPEIMKFLSIRILSLMV